MYLRRTKKLHTVIIKSFISINPSMTLVFKFPDAGVLKLIVPSSALTTVHSSKVGSIRIKRTVKCTEAGES